MAIEGIMSYKTESPLYQKDGSEAEVQLAETESEVDEYHFYMDRRLSGLCNGVSRSLGNMRLTLQEYQVPQSSTSIASHEGSF
jgi:hypothetical protein